MLDPHFLAGGDVNAKHVQWGSRLITPKGRELLHVTNVLNLKIISTRQPTYWPADKNRVSVRLRYL